MASLTATQLTNLRNDIGDNGTAQAFTDDELNAIFAAEGGQYDRSVLRALDQLLASAAKLADYSQNDSDEKRSQVFNHLLKLRDVWAKRVAAGESGGVRFTGLRGVPPRKKDRPRW